VFGAVLGSSRAKRPPKDAEARLPPPLDYRASFKTSDTFHTAHPSERRHLEAASRRHRRSQERPAPHVPSRL